MCVPMARTLADLLVSLSPPSAMAVTDLCPTLSNPSPSWRTAQSIPSNSSVCVRSRTGTVRWHYTPGLCLVQRKVWILVKIRDDVTEKLCVYNRLMWWKNDWSMNPNFVSKHSPGLPLVLRRLDVRLRRVPVQPGEWAVRTRGCHCRSLRTPRASWTCGPGTAPDVRDRLSGLF